jgi:rod shape-determining protein MreD
VAEAPILPRGGEELMRLVLFQREGGLPNKLVPFATTLLFVLLSLVPWHIPGFVVVTPAFALMAVYHWTIYRVDLLPPITVFAAGLLLDLLNGTPYVGVSALSLLITRTVLLDQRRFFVNRLFPVLWAGFLATATAVITFEWALVSVLHGSLLGTRPFVFETVLTVATFPIGSLILARAQRAFLARV